MDNFKNVLDLVENVGIYVVKKDNYEILYMNNYFKSLMPHIKIGDKCFNICPELCESCPLTSIENKKKGKILANGLPTTDLAEVTAKQILWNDEIPAYVISLISKTIDEKAKSEEIKKRNAYSVLAKVYPVIIAINLTQGTYNIINNQKAPFFNPEIANGSLLELFNYINNGVCEEQKAEFHKLFYPPLIKQAFENGKKEINMTCFSPTFMDKQTKKSMLHWRIIKASNFRSSDLLAVFTSQEITESNSDERHFLNFAYSNSEYISVRAIIKEEHLICIEKNEKLKKLLGVDEKNYNEALELCLNCSDKANYLNKLWKKAKNGRNLVLNYIAKNLSTNETLYFDLNGVKVSEYNGYPIYSLILKDKTKQVFKNIYNKNKLSITHKTTVVFKYYLDEDKFVYAVRKNDKTKYVSVENFCNSDINNGYFSPIDYKKLKASLKNNSLTKAELKLKFFNKEKHQFEDISVKYNSIIAGDKIINKYGLFECIEDENYLSANNEEFIEQLSTLVLDIYDIIVEYDFNTNLCYTLKFENGKYVKDIIPFEINTFIKNLLYPYIHNDYKAEILKIHTKEYLEEFFEGGEKALNYELKICPSKEALYLWYSLIIRPLGINSNRYIAMVKNINDLVLERIKNEKEVLKANTLAKIAVLEKELSEKSSLILLSQINPHFIFNTLNCIKGLSLTDTKKACSLIDNFSKYLRFNMSAINKKEPISFLTELEHIETYLTIEVSRFPDIEIEYDTSDTNFYIPPMTIQPIVENAILHGVCQKINGGKIKISSEITENYVIISIIDSGKGFCFDGNINSLPENKSLRNISHRLEKLVNGELSVYSRLNEGTKVSVKIPLKNAKERLYWFYENDFS